MKLAFFLLNLPAGTTLYCVMRPFYLVGVGLWLVVVVTYWTFGLGFLALDLRHRPTSLYARKIQAERSFDRKKLARLVAQLLFGQIVVLLPFALLLGWLAERGIGIVVTPQFPRIIDVAWQLGVFVAWEEVAFYYSHRVLHHRLFYERFHKMHHEFTAPIALCASYAHPVELATGNILPLILGPVLCRAHVATTALWFAVAVIGSQMHHCGYRFESAVLHLPGFDQQPDFHDFHHEVFRGNYGLIGVLDWFHGTDGRWRAALAVRKRQPEAVAEAEGGGGGRRRRSAARRRRGFGLLAVASSNASFRI